MTANVIQVDYDLLVEVARRFQQQGEEIEALERAVLGCLRPLQSGGWQGRGSEAFFAEMDEEVLPGMGRLAAGLAEASVTVRAIGNLFAMAEEEAAVQLEAGSGAPIASNGGGSGISGNFDLASLFFQPGRLFLDLVMFEKLTPLLKEIGQLSDPRIIGLLESNLFKGGLVGVDALFGLLDDLNQGTYGADFLKAVGINSIDSLIQFAIGEVHPYAAAALIVNGIVQIGGEIQIGVQRTLIDMLDIDAEMGALLHHDLDNMSGALEKMDLGNVTKELSEAIYEPGARRLGILADLSQVSANGAIALARDPSFQTLSGVASSFAQAVDGHGLDLFYMANPFTAFLPSGSGNDWHNLLDVGKAGVNVLDGAVDWSIASTAYKFNMGLNDVGTSFLVPDSMKPGMVEGIKDFIHWEQKITDGLIGLVGF